MLNNKWRVSFVLKTYLRVEISMINKSENCLLIFC